MAAIASRHVHFSFPPVSHVKYFPPASQRQDEDDLAAKIQRITNPDSDFIHDETDDDLPPIEKVLNSETRRVIPILDYNIGYNSQNPESPIVNTNENRIGSKQSRLDNDESHNTGTRGTPADPPIGPRCMYDVEDNRYVDGNGRPIPQLQPDSPTSTSMLAENIHCSRYCSSPLSQEHIKPDSNGKTIPDIFDDQTPESLCAHMEKMNKEESKEECTKELERDMLLAFEELEKSSSAAPEPSHCQPEQKRHQSSSTDKTIDEQSRSREQQQQHQYQRQEDSFNAAGTENQIRDDLESTGEAIFHADSADHHGEAADRDPHHASELQPRSKSTENQPVPASEIQTKCFRIRGIRTSQSADRRSVTTQYRIVWGRHPNKRSYWVKKGDIQLYMLIQPDAENCDSLCTSSKRNITKLRKTRISPYHASKRLYKYLVDDSLDWVSFAELWDEAVISRPGSENPFLKYWVTPKSHSRFLTEPLEQAFSRLFENGSLFYGGRSSQGVSTESA
ncbi:hypothetical protein F5884DRAFT_759015 [Xylogone sp. PMI_703]|nr:hypothetical protein F5884DRAFT_759015 [Xylogone sp. PMI_703]